MTKHDLYAYLCAAMSMWLPFQEHLCLKGQHCPLLRVSPIIPCFKLSESGDCRVMCNNLFSVYFRIFLHHRGGFSCGVCATAIMSSI